MKIEMELLSDAIPGSGEGLAGIIDSDITYNEFGIPYIPAKRKPYQINKIAIFSVRCNKTTRVKPDFTCKIPWGYLHY